jgi:hypothetical protein
MHASFSNEIMIPTCRMRACLGCVYVPCYCLNKMIQVSSMKVMFQIGRVIAQVVSHQPLTTVFCVCSLVSP